MTSKPSAITSVVVLFLALVVICPATTNHQAQSQPIGTDFGPDDNIQIFRQERKGRPKPREKVSLKPLLSLQWWLMIRGRDCRPQEVDSKAFFAAGDHLRVGIKTNQSGHLYVIVSGKGDSEGVLQFPDPRIGQNGNEIVKNRVIIAPYKCDLAGSDSYCPPKADSVNDCWWEFTGRRGEIVVTLIFSREEISTLEALIKQARPNPQGSTDLPKVSSALLDEIKREAAAKENFERKEFSPSPTKEGTIADNFRTQVLNTNRQNNEEIIETFTLKPRNSIDGMDVGILMKDDRGRFSPVDPKRAFKTGEQIRVEYTSKMDGFVYFINVDAEGVTNVIYRNEVRNGGDYIHPAPYEKKDVIEFTGNTGIETLRIIMSPENIPVLDKAYNQEGEIGGSPGTVKETLVGFVTPDPAAVCKGLELAAGGAKINCRGRELKVVSSNSNQGKISVVVAATGKKVQGDSSLDSFNPNSGEVAMLEIRLKHIPR